MYYVVRVDFCLIHFNNVYTYISNFFLKRTKNWYSIPITYSICVQWHNTKDSIWRYEKPSSLHFITNNVILYFIPTSFQAPIFLLVISSTSLSILNLLKYRCCWCYGIASFLLFPIRFVHKLRWMRNENKRRCNIFDVGPCNEFVAFVRFLDDNRLIFWS